MCGNKCKTCLFWVIKTKQNLWCDLLMKWIYNQSVELFTDFCVSPNDDFLLLSLSPEDDQTLYLFKDPPLPSACSLSPRPSTASLMKLMMKICSPVVFKLDEAPPAPLVTTLTPRFGVQSLSVQLVQQVNSIRIRFLFDTELQLNQLIDLSANQFVTRYHWYWLPSADYLLRWLNWNEADSIPDILVHTCCK